MANLNKISSDVVSLRKKVLKDAKTLLQMYSEFENDLGHKFRREVASSKGALEGLEDFRSLHVMVKRNRRSAQSALNILTRMKDIGVYRIEEENVDAELQQLLSD